MSNVWSMRHRAAVVVALLACWFVALACVPVRPALAAGTFIVQDDANLLRDSDVAQLKETYATLAEYVDAACVTTKEPSADVEDFAKAYVNSTFGSGAAVVFVIDMYNRQVCVYANEAGLSIVPENDARAIADNVYRYASDADWYGCADAALWQILSLCRGETVNSPMRHISNLLLALILGVLINFFMVYFSRARLMRRRASSQSMRDMAQLPQILGMSASVTKVQHIHHSSRSGGGGGGGGRGGGGGGGGGSHRF